MIRKQTLPSVASAAIVGFVILGGCGGGGGAGSDTDGDTSASDPVQNNDSVEYVSGAAITAANASQTLVEDCQGADQGFASDHFEVFSVDDFASTQELNAVASVAEHGFEQIRETLDVARNEIVGPDVAEPISVCVNNEAPDGNGQAWLWGFVFDQPLSGEITTEIRTSNARLLRHELVHVFNERLVKGADGQDPEHDTHEWFSEGAATFLSGQEVGTYPHEIDSYLDDVASDTARAVPDVQQDGDQELPYRTFALTLHHLFAPSEYGGGGNRVTDIAKVWREMRNHSGTGDAFSAAFEDVFGHSAHNIDNLSVHDFSENFVTWMQTFRDKAWSEGAVTGSDVDSIEEMNVYPEGHSGQFLAASQVSGGSFEVLITRLEPHEAYDVYFWTDLSEENGQWEATIHGPAKGYRSGSDLNAHGPDGGTQFDITNLPSNEYSGAS